jgi:hypothetical protein
MEDTSYPGVRVSLPDGFTVPSTPAAQLRRGATQAGPAPAALADPQRLRTAEATGPVALPLQFELNRSDALTPWAGVRDTSWEMSR